MNENPNIPEIDNETNQSALSILGDPNEEFPVLKAFQQYIDAEQSKARKRMLALCIFFGCLLTVVVVIFLYLLNSANERNQLLNDRMFAYATNNANNVIRESSAQDQVDSSAILKLTARIEELQNKLTEAQQRAIDAEKARAAAVNQATVVAESAKAKEPSPEELEIARLKSLLAAEREKAEAERKRRHEEELEAYRRKHYPELYQTPKAKKRVQIEPLYDLDEDDDEDEDELYKESKEQPLPKKGKTVLPTSSKKNQTKPSRAHDDIDALLDGIDSDGAIAYFDNTESNENDVTSESKPKNYAIPVDIKGSRSKWRIPND